MAHLGAEFAESRNEEGVPINEDLLDLRKHHLRYQLHFSLRNVGELRNSLAQLFFVIDKTSLLLFFACNFGGADWNRTSNEGVKIPCLTSGSPATSGNFRPRTSSAGKAVP